MRTKIDEGTAGKFLGRKLTLRSGATVFEGRVREFLIHLRQTAPQRQEVATGFYSPTVNKEWPLRGSFRVTRGIDGKRFELVLRKKGFVGREVTK